MTKNENYSYFLEDNGYWIRNETNFKIIATGLKLGVAQSLVTELNELYTERQSIASGFDKYQSHVAETNKKQSEIIDITTKQIKLVLEKHYNYTIQQMNKNTDNIIVYQVYELLKNSIKDIAEELGVELE